MSNRNLAGAKQVAPIQVDAAGQAFTAAAPATDVIPDTMDQLPALPPGDYTLYEVAGLRGLSWWTIPLNVDGTRNCSLWNYVWSQAGNLIFTVSKTVLQVTISIKEANLRRVGHRAVPLARSAVRSAVVTERPVAVVAERPVAVLAASMVAQISVSSASPSWRPRSARCRPRPRPSSTARWASRRAAEQLNPLAGFEPDIWSQLGRSASVEGPRMIRTRRVRWSPRRPVPAGGNGRCPMRCSSSSPV